MSLKIKIAWGSEMTRADNEGVHSTYVFETKGERDAFMRGVEQAIGWTEYEVITEDPVKLLDAVYLKLLKEGKLQILSEELIAACEDVLGVDHTTTAGLDEEVLRHREERKG